MYSVELLEKAVRDLYLSGVERGEYSVGDVEHMLHGIDFIALTQAVRHKSETMYAYTADSKQPKSLNYRSGELFDQRAARLCADFDQCVSEAVMASRTVELWILEDMTITAVACVSVDFGSGRPTLLRAIKAGKERKKGRFPLWELPKARKPFPPSPSPGAKIRRRFCC